ncbi:DNA transposase, partial [Frankliniella fusca]
MHIWSLTSTGARVRDAAKRRNVGLRDLAEMSGVSSDFAKDQNLVKVLKTTQEFRFIAIELRRKLVISQRRNKELSKTINVRTVNILNELVVSSKSRNILQGEMRNFFKKKPTGRRWSLQDKLFWLSVTKRGIRACRFLSNYLTIPSETSLKKILSKVNLQPGISQPFLALLKKKVENLKSRDRQCVLLFDEVFLRGRLFYNNIKNIVTGFEDFGQRGRTDFIADHAMVFMVQGLHVKWTQPIAYYFVSKTCPASLLKYLIEDVVKELTDIGIIVKATVSDQGPTNRTTINALRKSSGDNIIYSVAGQRLVHIWDMPHILKNIRNNLITSDLEFSNKKVAKWRQLIDFYIYDQTRTKLSSLTMRHVNPQGRDKMRISYAAQVFSACVSKVIKAIVSITEGKTLSHCLPFAELCDDIDAFFDLCNGPKTKELKENQKPCRVNISANSPDIKEDRWNKMISQLQTWTFIRKKDGVRHVPPCVQGIDRDIDRENIKSLEFARNVSPDTKKCQDDESHMASDLSEYLSNDEEPTSAPSAQQSLLRGETPNNFGRRPKVQGSNPLVRQSFKANWVELLPDVLKKLNCADCSNVLTTTTLHPSDR